MRRVGVPPLVVVMAAGVGAVRAVGCRRGGARVTSDAWHLAGRLISANGALWKGRTPLVERSRPTATPGDGRGGGGRPVGFRVGVEFLCHALLPLLLRNVRQIEKTRLLLKAGLRVLECLRITCSSRWRHGPGRVQHRRVNLSPFAYRSHGGASISGRTKPQCLVGAES